MFGNDKTKNNKKICYCLPTNFVRCLVKIDKKMVAIKNNSTGLLW